MNRRGNEQRRRWKTGSVLQLSAVILGLLAVPSCRNDSATIPQGGPALERTSVGYMLPAVTEAREAVAEAQEKLTSDPPDVEATKDSLLKARRSLSRLEWFYIPATDARENVYNAYLEHLAGHSEERDAYLESAKRTLALIAGRANYQVKPYVEELISRIEAVQSGIRDNTPVKTELKSLCEIFQLHLLKARLVLDENAFDERENAATTHNKEVNDVNQQ